MKMIEAKSLIMYGLMLFACAVVLNAAATPTEDNSFDFIDTTLSEDGVISLTGANASKVHPAVINSGFDKYTNVIAPNGSPIHILGQSQVSNAQMARARRILEFYLTSNGNKYGLTGTGADGTIKAEIANTMADRNATLVYTNQAGGIEDLPNIDAFFELNLLLQDLGGNESPVPGSSDWLTNDVRDASYEEIFHLVHGKGIAHVDRTLNGWHNPVNAAADKAWGGNSVAGIWHIDDGMYQELFAEENSTHPSNPDEEGAPGGSVPLEYIISCIDVYYGLWEHTGPNGVSFFGEYDPNSRARLLAEDPDGYALVEQFMPPKLEYRETIDSSFNGTFSLTLDPPQAYTYKSQYYQHVSLSGSNNSDLTGNGFDNRLQGNAGNNILRGEAGSDVAIFKGAQSQYVLTQNSDGSVTVVDSQSGRDGSDTLIGFESIEFSDGTAALPLEAAATPTPAPIATNTPAPPTPPLQPTATNTPVLQAPTATPDPVENSNLISLSNSGLAITVEFVEPLTMQDGSEQQWTPALRQPYINAVNRWLEVLKGVKGKTEHELYVSFVVETFDDGLGAAQPFYDVLEVVDGNYIPTEGEVLISNYTYSQKFADEFDGEAERDAEFNANIQHELGHVFGIGTLWNLSMENGEIIDDAETFNIREWAVDSDVYKGPIYQQENGVEQYNKLFGTHFDFVPLIIETKDHLFGISDDDPERILDDGTVVPDLAEALMANGQLLTTVTLGMLDDIGWEIDYSRADVYPVQADGPTPTPVSVATETPLPAPTVTPVPAPANTPTPTETPDGPGDENESIAYYEFDQVDLSGNGWAEIPGGFGSAASGSLAFLSDLEGLVESSDDQLGLKITVDAGEVTFLFAQEAIEVDAPILMRVTLRTSGPVSLALIGLKGDLSTGQAIDGSLALNYPLATASFVEEEGALTMVYQPDQGSVFTPAIQVSTSGDAVSVMIDRFEAYALDDEFSYDSVLFERQ